MGANSPEKPNPKPGQITRNSFISRMAVGAAALFVGANIPRDTFFKPQSEQPEAQEQLKPISPKVTVIDMDSSEANDEIISKLLQGRAQGDEGETIEFVRGFLDHYFSHGEDVAGVIQGELTRQGLRADGIQKIPLQRSFDNTTLQFLENDELGNLQTRFTIPPEKVIGLLETDPNNVINMSFQVGDIYVKVNKFYMGVSEKKEAEIEEKYTIQSQAWIVPDEKGNELYYVNYDESQSDPPNTFKDAKGNNITPITKEEYDEISKQNRERSWKEKEEELEALPKNEVRQNPYPGLSINGAYAKEKAQTNLPKLFEICNAFPDKLFVVAVGNEGEDIREALESLKDTRPQNLIIVGQWGSDLEPHNQPKWNAYGADIYVDNEHYGYKSGSSFSTPVISAYASVLFEKGFSLEEVKKQIFDASVLHTFRDKDGLEQNARVLNNDLAAK